MLQKCGAGPKGWLPGPVPDPHSWLCAAHGDLDCAGMQLSFFLQLHSRKAPSLSHRGFLVSENIKDCEH